MSGFRSFATLLATPAPASAAPAAPAPPPAPPPPPRPPVAVPDQQITNVIQGFAAELRRLRARAVEIFEMECEMMLAAVAGEVLARELVLAPADIAAIVARATAQLGAQTLRVRLAPTDAATIGEPGVEADPALEAGDAIFETASGTIDMRLGSRVRAMLDARTIVT